MKYFSKIKSLNNLKDQYRKLALANHPDKGGNTKTMQEINIEYDILFPIWKDKLKNTSNETAQSTRKEFYTQYGWKGEKYNSNLRMTDITKIVREYVKEKYPTYKFSVRTSDVYSLDISLMEAPQEVFIYENLSEYDKSEYEAKKLDVQVNHYYIEKDDRLTELCKGILNDVKGFSQTYNFDDSDSMIDYFHTNFYLHMTIGKWDKPFRVVEKTARIKAEKPKKNTPEQTGSNLTIEEYSEKSFVVRGDTYAAKDKLTDLGGKYNKSLKGGAGYIFSNKSRKDVEKFVEKSYNQKEMI